MIACRLFFRDIRQDLYDYCVKNAVVPPERVRKWRLEKWIEDHRAAARSASASSNARRGVTGRPQSRGVLAIR